MIPESTKMRWFISWVIEKVFSLVLPIVRWVSPLKESSRCPKVIVRFLHWSGSAIMDVYYENQARRRVWIYREYQDMVESRPVTRYRPTYEMLKEKRLEAEQEAVVNGDN